VNRERVLRLIADVCLSRTGRDRLANLDALLDEHGITGSDRTALLAEGARLGVYRALVRNNLGNVAFRLLAKTRRLVNAAANDAFDDLFVDFLDAVGPRSPLLRDLPRELVDFATERWSTDPRIPPWALELARHELALFEADAAPDDTARDSAPEAIDLEAHFGRAPGATLARYAHAVHHVSDAEDDEAPPREESVAILVSRDAAGEVHTTALSPFEARLTAALFDGIALGSAVQAAAETSGTALEPALLTAAAKTIALLAERGAFGYRTNTRDLLE
jgi:hypothetical protein